MKQTLLIISFILLCSYNYFETKKIEAETFYEDEVKTIDWGDVDAYPLFSGCNDITEKAESADCFFKTLSSSIYNNLEAKNLVTLKNVNQEIRLKVTVFDTKEMEVATITMDSITRAEFPLLESWLRESVSSLQVDVPALKRGVPVTTVFELPLVFRTES